MLLVYIINLEKSPAAPAAAAAVTPKIVYCEAANERSELIFTHRVRFVIQYVVLNFEGDWSMGLGFIGDLICY